MVEENKNLSLTVADQKLLDKIIAPYVEKRKVQWTIETYINGWGKCVTDIRERNDYLYYVDYSHDLFRREILSRIIKSCPYELQEKIKSFVSQIDKEFKELTLILEKPLSKEVHPNLWWWYRIPIRPGKALKEDLLHIYKTIK